MNSSDRSWWRHPPKIAIDRYRNLAEKTRLRLGEPPSLPAPATSTDPPPPAAPRTGTPSTPQGRCHGHPPYRLSSYCSNSISSDRSRSRT
jgi:hypothetical protein